MTRSGKSEAENLANSGEGDSPTPPRVGKKIDLRDAHAIRRELGSVYRDMRAGKIEYKAGTSLAHVLEIMRRTYETSELQSRLEALEALRNGV